MATSIEPLKTEIDKHDEHDRLTTLHKSLSFLETSAVIFAAVRNKYCSLSFELQRLLRVLLKNVIKREQNLRYELPKLIILIIIKN